MIIYHKLIINYGFVEKCCEESLKNLNVQLFASVYWYKLLLFILFLLLIKSFDSVDVISHGRAAQLFDGKQLKNVINKCLRKWTVVLIIVIVATPCGGYSPA